MTLLPDFVGFPKIGRLNREIIITEKLDGTNAQIFIPEDGGDIIAGSRTRWITPASDNYGFAGWVERNREELLKLGPGHHFGEWWGAGIQRRYDLPEKRFSLFNTARWAPDAVARTVDEWGKDVNKLIGRAGVIEIRNGEVVGSGPNCCHVVPTLYRGPFAAHEIYNALRTLEDCGSRAAPGFRNPEGIVIYHTAGNVSFKVTLEHDEQHKGPQ